MKRYPLICSIIYLTVLCLSLASCNTASANQNGLYDEQACQKHIDFDEDLFCDYCEATIEPVCKKHIDYNHDGICDTENCNYKMSVTHSDLDGDGICDTFLCSKILNSKNDTEFPDVDSQIPNDNHNETPLPDPEIEVPSVTQCEVCVDINENLFCDVCGKLIEKNTETGVLIKDGKVNFLIVFDRSNLSSEEITEIKNFVYYLHDIGISPSICDQSCPYVCAETEIFINRISFRDDIYDVDPHYLGPKGFSITSYGNKILVRAGSDSALSDAFNHLKQNVFSNSSTTNLVFKPSDSIERIQTDYKFKDILIGESSIRDYKISYPKSDKELQKLAVEIRNAVYDNAGYWLALVEASDLSGQKYIHLKNGEKSGSLGFLVKIHENDSLEIISEFPEKTFDAGMKYLALVFGAQTNKATFIETQINIRDISYGDFGAVGDGITNDFKAIKATHDYANKYNYTVVADPFAKYYISSISETITIRTSTFWNGATFIIDDRDITVGSESDISIFTVASDYTPIVLTCNSETIKKINSSGGIDSDADKVNLSIGYDAILVIDGIYATESVFVDKNGYFKENHSLHSDFDSVESITVIRTDDTPITVEGGIFITYSNQQKQDVPFVRNIKVNRSNTVLSSLSYEISYEPQIDNGASHYLAFIEISKAYNVSVSDCTFQSRSLYLQEIENPIISATLSHSVTIYNCDQADFFSFSELVPSVKRAKAICIYSSKDVTVDNSIVKEIFFDKDTYNATVKNSSIFKIHSENNVVTLENNTVFE